MTNQLLVIINSLKVPKIKKILLYDMKFLVPNYSCLQNPWLWGCRPQIPVLSILCPQVNLLNPHPPPEQNSWVRHWTQINQDRLILVSVGDWFNQSKPLHIFQTHIHIVHRITDKNGRMCSTYGRDQECVKNVDRIIWSGGIYGKN